MYIKVHSIIRIGGWVLNSILKKKGENSRHDHGARQILVVVGSRVVRLENIFLFTEMRV